MPWLSLLKSKGRTTRQCVSQATVLISEITNPVKNSLTAEQEVKKMPEKIKKNVAIHAAGDNMWGNKQLLLTLYTSIRYKLKKINIFAYI